MWVGGGGGVETQTPKGVQRIGVESHLHPFFSFMLPSQFLSCYIFPLRAGLFLIIDRLCSMFLPSDHFMLIYRCCSST